MMKFLLYIFMLNFLIFMDYNLLMVFLFNLLMLLSLLFLLINKNFSWMMIYSWLGFDSISYILVILSIWIISLMFLSSLNFPKKNFYSLVLLFLLICLFVCFSSMNYFLFYLFFEVSLIPTFMLIMGWGYQPERLGASMYMLMYTMFASLPFLILLFYLYSMIGSLNYSFMMNMILNLNMFNLILYFFMLFAFLVKLPLFMFHLWLPKAHIEAPVTGSMILAAVLLKLGGYGCYRSMMFMLNLCSSFNYLFSGFCLVGMVVLSIMSMRCNDFKLIVAYSSVVHMGMMLLGLLSMSITGFFGGFIMMIGHGFCSSALFFLVNVFYVRTKSRNLILNKGMLMYFPNLVMWWFLFCVINMAAPISLNLLSEMFILMSMASWFYPIFLVLSVGMYFSAMYSLYMFSYLIHGSGSTLLMKFNTIKVSEYMVLLLHWIPLNFLILKVEIFY
uniref:NADH-ubiquinone oxidoreductase chain 4 n=1 Tax=Sycophila sp. 2 JXW-2020 TaxID=2781670 RepID=A0A8A3USB2_9HYME|nr:NADH dehydrogenase subunit 4 [Sycophila sp. 2 JXW-2020]